MEDIELIRRKAEMFDALMSCDKVVVHRATGLGNERYQHLKIELWSKHLGSESSNQRGVTNDGKRMLAQFAQTQANAIRKG